CVLVSGAAAGQLLAAAGHEPDLPADHAGAGTVHFDDFQHAAAGDDDVDLLLHDADDVSLRVRVSDREHAVVDSAYYLPHSAPLFRDHPARHFFEGCGPGDALA